MLGDTNLQTPQIQKYMFVILQPKTLIVSCFSNFEMLFTAASIYLARTRYTFFFLRTSNFRAEAQVLIFFLDLSLKTFLRCSYLVHTRYRANQGGSEWGEGVHTRRLKCHFFVGCQ